MAHRYKLYPSTSLKKSYKSGGGGWYTVHVPWIQGGQHMMLLEAGCPLWLFCVNSMFRPIKANDESRWSARTRTTENHQLATCCDHIVGGLNRVVVVLPTCTWCLLLILMMLFVLFMLVLDVYWSCLRLLMIETTWPFESWCVVGYQLICRCVILFVV